MTLIKKTTKRTTKGSKEQPLMLRYP